MHSVGPPEATNGPVASPKPPGIKGYAFAVAMAVAGGLLGIIGAFIQELRGANLFLGFLAAPVVEEALKPAGVYILQVKWPRLLPNQLFTATLSGISGMVFGLVESTVYVKVYFPHHSHALVVFRYTVDVGLHTLCSFIVGLGINQRLIDSAEGKVPFLQGSRVYYITAIAIHSLFNITVVALIALGVWDIR